MSDVLHFQSNRQGTTSELEQYRGQDLVGSRTFINAVTGHRATDRVSQLIQNPACKTNIGVTYQDDLNVEILLVLLLHPCTHKSGNGFKRL